MPVMRGKGSGTGLGGRWRCSRPVSSRDAEKGQGRDWAGDGAAPVPFPRGTRKRVRDGTGLVVPSLTGSQGRKTMDVAASFRVGIDQQVGEQVTEAPR
ncbi:hypothetical protein GCM10025866_33540 [Naasia aerilata]|uniref:Uncharacterized protein n=1 Tax=Naasia aerilata TaxID=1162966 RepID=A0ABN6XUW8_9MICO|nr:hypothetical protein GCM10025866_33540 [Naasia aerilata]